MVSMQSIDKNKYLIIKNGHLFIARLIDRVMDILYDTSLIMSNCDQPSIHLKCEGRVNITFGTVTTNLSVKIPFL